MNSEFNLYKSKSFVNSIESYSLDYKLNYGIKTANNFLNEVNKSISFIKENPLACSPYIHENSSREYKDINLRKWPIKGFNCSIYFSLLSNKKIYINFIHFSRMDISDKLNELF